METDADRCYVCLEEDGVGMLRHVCECRSAAVHATCLRRWIATSRRVHCAVCGEAFAEVRQVEHPTRLQRAALKALTCLSAIPLVGFFVWVAVDHDPCVACVVLGVAMAFLSVVVSCVAATVTDGYQVRTTIVFQGEVV